MDNELDRNLDKMVDAEIEEAFIQQREKYNYEDEIANAEDFYCCDECVGQTIFYLRKGK